MRLSQKSVTFSSSLMRFPLLLNFWTACLVIGLISVVCAAPRPVDNAMASLSDDQSLPPSSPFSSTVEIQPRVFRDVLALIEVTFPYDNADSMTIDEEPRARAVIRAAIKKAAEVLDIKVKKSPGQKLKMEMPGFRFYNYPGHWTREMKLKAQLYGPDVCKGECTLSAEEVQGSPGYYDMRIWDRAGKSVFSATQVWVKSEANLYMGQEKIRQKERLQDRFRRPTYH
ncbi:hypothetical protein F5050DRAFT_1168924 [Lentinula boryana]|uniref:Uncharacterized protein n=1 Tax=Lentinula boryana TaxID=40481 RepID=A0ABQ8PZ33_9AGAR|nr:hypothetical protein F5050DRAFT_1168924 [Lentinula boryana]